MLVRPLVYVRHGRHSAGCERDLDVGAHDCGVRVRLSALQRRRRTAAPAERWVDEAPPALVCCARRRTSAFEVSNRSSVTVNPDLFQTLVVHQDRAPARDLMSPPLEPTY